MSARFSPQVRSAPLCAKPQPGARASSRRLATPPITTGSRDLPNRRLLLDRLGQALASARRRKGCLALLLLDLDDFKRVNDRLGHTAGDRVLQLVANRLLASLRGGDTACRYGGDEFVVLLPEIEYERRAWFVARKIRDCLARPYPVDDHALQLTASVGVAVYPIAGVDQEALIRHADAAMYLAKSGRASSVGQGSVSALS
jgi:diguanylate cyclase